MHTIDMYNLIGSYDEGYFYLAKRRFATYEKEIAKLYNDKTTETLLEVICSENVLYAIEQRTFAKMIKSMFQEFDNPKFIYKYMSAAYELVAESKTLKYTNRAAKYYENLNNAYIDKVKDKNSDIQNKNAEEVLEFLLDYMKKTLILYGEVMKVGDNISEISNISNEINVFVAERFTLAFFNFIDADETDNNAVSMENDESAEIDSNQTPIKEKMKPFEIFGQAVDAVAEKNAKSKNDRKQKKRINQIYRLITWLLFYRLCQDDGYIPEE